MIKSKEKLKGVQEKESIMTVLVCIEKSILWHHTASHVMPNSDPWDRFFYTHQTVIIVFFYCSLDLLTGRTNKQYGEDLYLDSVPITLSHTVGAGNTQ